MSVGKSPDLELRSGIVEALVHECAINGFEVEKRGGDPDWLWFRRRPEGAPASVQQLVSAYLASRRAGGFVIRGHAFLFSAAVGQFLEGIPAEARLDSPVVDPDSVNYVDHEGFDSLVQPKDLSLVFPIPVVHEVAEGVGKYLSTVNGPVSTWFSARETLDDLKTLAVTPHEPGVPESVLPNRFRGTVVLCLVERRPDDAAALMDWYLSRDSLHFMDSLERARAFELALRGYFREYTDLRGGHTIS
ncbi:hypothetical protein [Nocardia jiangsuensis]|uniref:Uncharacterized protein n=1 Tax=Nocardia jiangsuensis TaxID=1691563 RepID=A0ABV8DUJ1_9NOCA